MTQTPDLTGAPTGEDWHATPTGPLSLDPAPEPHRRPQNALDPMTLVQLTAIVRRPPALNSTPGADASPLEAAMLRHAAPILQLSTGKLAFSISELVVRREREIRDGGDIEALDGMASLGLIARMFEHLAMMQARSERG